MAQLIIEIFRITDRHTTAKDRLNEQLFLCLASKLANFCGRHCLGREIVTVNVSRHEHDTGWVINILPDGRARAEDGFMIATGEERDLVVPPGSQPVMRQNRSPADSRLCSTVDECNPIGEHLLQKLDLG